MPSCARMPTGRSNSPAYLVLSPLEWHAHRSPAPGHRLHDDMLQHVAATPTFRRGCMTNRAPLSRPPPPPPFSGPGRRRGALDPALRRRAHRGAQRQARFYLPFFQMLPPSPPAIPSSLYSPFDAGFQPYPGLSINLDSVSSTSTRSLSFVRPRPPFTSSQVARV